MKTLLNQWLETHNDRKKSSLESTAVREKAAQLYDFLLKEAQEASTSGHGSSAKPTASTSEQAASTSGHSSSAEPTTSTSARAASTSGLGSFAEPTVSTSAPTSSYTFQATKVV